MTISEALDQVTTGPRDSLPEVIVTKDPDDPSVAWVVEKDFGSAIDDGVCSRLTVYRGSAVVWQGLVTRDHLESNPVLEAFYWQVTTGGVP